MSVRRLDKRAYNLSSQRISPIRKSVAPPLQVLLVQLSSSPRNKGLAPKRNKDSRNPRVKKRKKFEEKKKKLGSIRQLYKGGEGPGGYGGELTGIKKNLVKSVKL